MRVPFVKMHGCGNDFVIFDERTRTFGLSPARAAAIADRRTGVGCDQFIVIEAATDGADAFMRIRNPDGSEAGACGNATRCVASLLTVETGRGDLTIRTIAGDLRAKILPDGRVCVDMGPARLDWAEVPLAYAMDTLHVPLAGDPAACSMGNPHATFFVRDVEHLPVEALGPPLETDTIFPQKANIGFAEIRDSGKMRLRVWERGAGLTLACGSGACAAVVNAHRRGLTGRRVQVLVDGGALDIEWREDSHVLMTGPIATSFTGTLDLADFPA